jgi:hypothetical protein
MKRGIMNKKKEVKYAPGLFSYRGCKGGWMRMGPAQLKEEEDYVRL